MLSGGHCLYPLRPRTSFLRPLAAARAAPNQYPKNVATYAASSGTASTFGDRNAITSSATVKPTFTSQPRKNPRAALAVAPSPCRSIANAIKRRRRHADAGTQQRRCARTGTRPSRSRRSPRSPRAGPDTARRPAPGAGLSARRGCSRPHPASGQQKSHVMPAVPTTGGVESVTRASSRRGAASGKARQYREVLAVLQIRNLPRMLRHERSDSGWRV